MQCVWQFFSIWSGQKLTPGKFAVLPILGNYLQSGSNSSRLSDTPPCLALKSCEGFIMFICFATCGLLRLIFQFSLTVKFVNECRKMSNKLINHLTSDLSIEQKYGEKSDHAIPEKGVPMSPSPPCRTKMGGPMSPKRPP